MLESLLLRQIREQVEYLLNYSQLATDTRVVLSPTLSQENFLAHPRHHSRFNDPEQSMYEEIIKSLSQTVELKFSIYDLLSV